MFGKNKEIPQIDKEQLELIKIAQKRIKQKKRLFAHFVIFLIGAVFLIILNTVLRIGESFRPFDVDWFVYTILLWLFLFVYHLFNVFITHKFMGKAWEAHQLNKLVALQKERIEVLKKKLPNDGLFLDKPGISTREQLSNPHQQLTIIVAASDNNAIGKDNKLIWHLGDDLKRFKNLTSGHHIIMGRKTFESLEKPLPNRTHIVITKQVNYQVPSGVLVVNTLAEAVHAVHNDNTPYIIGGGEIYQQSLSIATKIEMTRVHDTFEADTFFPKIDASVWKETNNIFHRKDENNGYDYSFITYERR